MKQLTIQESQDRLLEMGKAIHAVLTKHNISYMITFGTLLGAIRHGGFIPWDDDFDIFLFDSEYESAIKFLKQELPTEMFVEDSDSEPLYFHSWAHVKDKRTIAFCEQFPQDNIYSHKGLSIDLYRAFPMLESEVNLFRLEENLKYQTRKKKIGLISDKEFDIISAKINEEISEEKNKNAFSDREVLGMVMNERLIYSDFVFCC